MIKHPPKRLQGVLWSVSVDKLDLQKDKNYIINQVLAFGSLTELKWLFKTYAKTIVREIFITHPQKEYTRPAFNYWSNVIFKLENSHLSPNKYVRDLPRDIRS